MLNKCIFQKSVVSVETHIYLQNLASIQPRTSPFKYARSSSADRSVARASRAGSAASSPATRDTRPAPRARPRRMGPACKKGSWRNRILKIWANMYERERERERDLNSENPAFCSKSSPPYVPRVLYFLVSSESCVKLPILFSVVFWPSPSLWTGSLCKSKYPELPRSVV